MAAICKGLDLGTAHRTIQDLSRKKSRAEEALRASEQRYRDLIETAPDLICTVNREGRFTSLNPAFTAIHGWPVNEWLGQPFLKLIHADDRPCAERAFADALQGKKPPVVELRCLTKTGEYVYVEVTSSPQVEEGNVVGALGIVRNVTRRKQLEEQYRQAQRMEAVGTLAGGVAHDFNNLLTVISGCSEVLIDGLSADETHCQIAGEIRNAGARAAALTRQLLAFSRKQVLAPVPLNLNDVVAEMEKMLRRLIGEDIDLATTLEPALGRVHADPGQIEQVLMNLVVNSRDAMPKGGQLTITTRNVQLEESFGKGHAGVTAKPGPYVLITVKDNGCGISPKNRTRIFEPLFTTKAPGKGTGLGLATVYGIVKQSGGEIEVQSEPGKGTVFSIYFPRWDEPEARVEPAAFRVPRGTETVLLAEDDDGVRALTRMALEANGYTVLEARNGNEALQLQAGFAGDIALLLTDVVMPHMSGRELADEMAGRCPGLKVLYVSGYLDDAVVRHGILESRMAFLQKPYSPAVLARKVREVLDAPRQARPIEVTPKELFVQSLERCKKLDDFIPRFYKRFLASSPEVAERFRFTDFSKQSRMLLHSLELAAGATLGKPHSTQELAERAKSHDRDHLNIRPELYEHWLDELVATARECDVEWNDHIETAWRKILGHVISFMQATRLTASNSSTVARSGRRSASSSWGAAAKSQ